MIGRSPVPKPPSIRTMLSAGGHKLDVGCAREVAALILAQPRKLRQLVECLCDPDPGIANRAVDALERASAQKPAILAPWKDLLLGRMADATEKKLRWNLALLVSRIELSPHEIERAASILRTYLDDSSSLVKTAAMHGLAGLARQSPAMLPEVLDLLRMLSRSGTPAMRARGRILLSHLETSGRRSSRAGSGLQSPFA